LTEACFDRVVLWRVGNIEDYPKTPEGISKNINVMSKGILGISKEI
jgi:hypothetical protein